MFKYYSNGSELNIYHSSFASSEKNRLTNKEIIEGNIVNYFNSGVWEEVEVTHIDNKKRIVWFKKELMYRERKTGKFHFWWDYFIDASVFVKAIQV